LKKLLVVWPVHRKDWISVFSSLREDFEFIFLASIFEQPINYVTPFAKTIYWCNYSSAQQLLVDVAPDKIIFMSIDSGLSMILNHTAQAQKIKTTILQHGIYTNYQDYRNREKIWKKSAVSNQMQIMKDQGQFNTLKFAQNSLTGLDKGWILLIFLYQKLVQIKGPYWAAKHLPLKLKRATKYLCFSPYNATIHKETDRISDDLITYIGSVELEQYLEKEIQLDLQPYLLHIDQALAENSFGEATVTKNEMTEFYLKLNKYSLSKEAKLFIKLHPESYDADWLPQHHNIKYIKQVDNLNQLIQSAKGCFGFYSTLVIPAAYWCPTVLFEIQYSGLQSKLKEICNLPILPFYNFESKDIQFQPVQNSAEISEVFINPNHKTSLERLKETL